MPLPGAGRGGASFVSETWQRCQQTGALQRFREAGTVLPATWKPSEKTRRDRNPRAKRGDCDPANDSFDDF